MTRSPLLFPPLLATLVVVGCTRVGIGDTPRPTTDVEPAIEAGAISRSAEVAGSQLLRRAEAAFERDDYEDALAAARQVVDSFPTLPGSSTALRIAAESSFRTEDFAGADVLSGRYSGLFPANDPRAAAARVVQGRARMEAGDAAGAVSAFILIPGSAPDNARTEALGLVRDLVRGVESERLAQIAAEAPFETDVLAPVLAEHAVGLYFRGEEEEARAVARRAADLARDGEERRIAQGVIEGRLEEVIGDAPLIGAMLPTSGSPTMREYATFVEEGIRAAISDEEERARRPVRLQVFDSGGRPEEAQDLLAELEQSGAVAIVGPLQDATLGRVAGSRRRPLPIVTPTARTLPEGEEAVYSLAGPDPGAARALARYARQSGIDRVVVLSASSQQSMFDAEVFASTFRSVGGDVLREMSYPSGQTDFREEMREIARLQPDGLVLPVPAADVRLVAPQVTFFGLDSLGIQVLGTADWATQDVLQGVAPRHTDGVFTVTPRLPGGQGEAYRRFVRTYEELFRKSLRSDIPALGWDVAGLLITAFQSGARRPSDVREALERIEAFEGATGTLFRRIRQHHTDLPRRSDPE